MVRSFARLNKVYYHKTSEDRGERCDQVQSEGLSANPTKCFGIAQLPHSVDDAEEHQRNRNQLKRIDEQGSKWRDPVGGELGSTCKCRSDGPKKTRAHSEQNFVVKFHNWCD